MEALTVLKSMRDKPKDQDKLAGRKLKEDAKEAEKKDVPKKASDKRKKGSPMNQSRIMCNARCAGTCEQRGLRKTSCTCGEGQNGKWCNTNKELKTKKNEYCAAFTDGQKETHCAKDWDIDTQKEMLK
jgi:hypothetical protein